MSDLTTYDLLPRQASALAQIINQHFVKPLLQGHTTLNAKERTLVAQSHGPSHRQNPDLIITDLTTLVIFLSTIIPPTLLHPVISALPMLIDDTLAFLSLRSASIDDLPEFSTLVDAVARLETQIVNLGWATGTSLSTWAKGTSIWFSNRQSTVLVETRNMVVRESRTLKTVLISSGIDISSKQAISEPLAVGKDVPVVQTEQEREPISENSENNDDDEELDAWGFDTDIDEIVEDQPQDVNGDIVTDSWEWNEDNNDLNPSSVDADSFPYTVSSIPDSLMEFLERILNEGALLRSPR